ncbi:MAG: threonine synthase [Planctomycetes bacterium]|nr:threonine synthase [Planctomycetota bacterium]
MGCVTNLTCVRCGGEVPPPASAGTCPACDDPFAVLDVQYDLDRARRTLTRAALAGRPANHWRYHELLPVEPDATALAWPVGFTPLLDATRLAMWAGCAGLRLKDDTRNPTASFKDRASSVGVVHALRAGAERVACASTGNAASSLAGFAAMAGLPATIFVPRSAPEPKVAQLLVYGADVRRVRGSYAEAYELCSRQCAEHGWYNRNCAINPYLVEGKKTCGLEIAEQTADRPASWVAVSVGDGCTIAGIGRGLTQMKALGLLAGRPRLLGVQAAGVAPIAEAFTTGSAFDPARAAGGSTMADSIDVPVPRNWRKAVREVGISGGAFVHVTDDEIAEAMLATGRLAGVFAEPAAAASVAGVRRAVLDGLIEVTDDVVAVVTGSGLKDIAGAMSVAGEPVEVDPA